MLAKLKYVMRMLKSAFATQKRKGSNFRLLNLISKNVGSNLRFLTSPEREIAKNAKTYFG